MQKKKGFTLIEILIVVAIIAVLAGTIIIVIGPGERLKETREAARESHMNAIGNAIYTAVVDCTTAGIEANHCGTVQEVLTRCVNDTTWVFAPDQTNCQITIAAPKDPATGNDYYVNPTLVGGRVHVWADSSESVWECDDTGTDPCEGTPKIY